MPDSRRRIIFVNPRPDRMVKMKSELIGTTVYYECTFKNETLANEAYQQMVESMLKLDGVKVAS